RRSGWAEPPCPRDALGVSGAVDWPAVCNPRQNSATDSGVSIELKLATCSWRTLPLSRRVSTKLIARPQGGSRKCTSIVLPRYAPGLARSRPFPSGRGLSWLLSPVLGERRVIRSPRRRGRERIQES